MERGITGFYHDPPIFIAETPIAEDRQTIDFDLFSRNVFQNKLSTGLEMKATVDGLFAFNFQDMSGYTYPADENYTVTRFNHTADILIKRTRLMNAFLAFFYTQELKRDNFSRERMVVTPELTIAMDSLGPMSSQGYGNQRVSHLTQSRFPSTYRQDIPYSMDNRIMMRGVPVSVEVVEAAVTDLEKLARVYGDEGILLVDLHLRASKAYQDHDHSLSLINNWTIIERLLNELWSRLQVDYETRDGTQFISKERRKRLQDGRTFSASVMSEMLSFLDYLPKDIYDDMSKIRKTRNEWMHGLKIVGPDTSELAGSVSQRMMNLVKNIEIRGTTGRRIHG